MNAKLVLAVLIAGAIAAWMWTGSIVVSGSAEEAAVRPPAERSQAAAKPFRVKAETITAVERPRSLVVRGRTRAYAVVTVAAETVGRVEERPVERGDVVKTGDLLCRLDAGAREANLARAKAEREKATLDFEASTKLRGRGFESDTRVATTRAALDAANAEVAVAQLDVDRTFVRAPVDGTIEDPIADVGTMLAVGSVCATIVDDTPIHITGQVSERDIASVRHGVETRVELITGETVTGHVSFISRAADPDTRTFKVEVLIPNDDGALRAGVTAEAHIPLPPLTAHRLSPGVLTLGPSGEIGVRTVDEDSVVHFNPVTIAIQDREGLWVTGLPQTVTIVTVGQDYVIEGQHVIAVTEDGESEGNAS